MLDTVFFVGQLPLVNDVINEIKKLIMKQERYITIDNINDCYSSVDCHNCHPCVKLYIKNGKITSIMRIDFTTTSVFNYKKAMIHPQFLSIPTPLNTHYHDKNGMIKNITLKKDLSQCKQGYYTCELPLILKHQIV
jgi:hypothetical protein